MKFIPQFPVQQLSGKDGNTNGLVAMRSNGIDIFRRFVVPDNPQTTNQVLARSIFTLAAQNFKNLSDSNRATWTTYAQNNPITVLGREITLQDMAAYIQCDFYSYLRDTSHLTSAPTAVAGFTGSAIGSVQYDAGTTVFSFQLTHNGTNGVGDWAVRITNSLASAQRNARPSDFRLADGVTSDSIIAVTTSPQTIQITGPVFTWEDGDYMEIEVVPLSDDCAIGTPYRYKQQISVES